MFTLDLSDYPLPRPHVSQGVENLTLWEKSTPHFYAVIDYEEPYVQPLILSALESRLPQSSYTVISSASDVPDNGHPILHIRQYERLPFEDAMAHPETCLMNAYVIRKALIRKNYLNNTAHSWITKHPSSILATNIKAACDFELDYAEFLDDALVEAWELQASSQKNEGKEPVDREWWILKPGMSDRGQGIRLFSTQEELQSIFEQWESELPESDDEDEDEDGDEERDDAATESPTNNNDYIMTSQLRHFVAQPYIHPPLLLPSNPHKFHIRTYVLAVGSLKIYVYRSMLALFASTAYTPPWADSDPNAPDALRAHLTNTCLQDGSREGSVVEFWDLPSEIPSLPSTTNWKDSVFQQICAITGEIFEAAARTQSIHFQTLPNAFEIFGLDFLVDDRGKAWLLEVNAFPDFKQTGEELSALVAGLWEGVVDVAVKPFFGLGGEGKEEHGVNETMVLVKELDLGRR